jgi:hypothetical protein
VDTIRQGRSLGDDADKETINLAETSLKLSDRDLLQYIEEWLQRIIPKEGKRGKGRGTGAPTKNCSQENTCRGPRAAAYKKAQNLNAVHISKNHCGTNELSVSVISNRKCHEKCVLFAPQWFFDFFCTLRYS